LALLRLARCRTVEMAAARRRSASADFCRPGLGIAGLDRVPGRVLRNRRDRHDLVWGVCRRLGVALVPPVRWRRQAAGSGTDATQSLENIMRILVVGAGAIGG